MKIKYESQVFLLFHFVFTISCHTNSEKLIDNGVHKIDFQKAEVRRFDDLVLFKDTIKLQGNPDLIKRVDKILCIENDYLVVDESLGNIFLFDSKGNFIRKIGHKGTDPFSYRDINDIIYNPGLNQILILSSKDQSIYIYDSLGKLISKIKLNFSMKSFALNRSNHFIFDHGFNNNENLNLSFANYKADILKSTFSYPKLSTSMVIDFLGGINKNGPLITYVHGASPDIYQIDANDSVFKIIDIEINNEAEEKHLYDFFKFINDLMSFEVSYLHNDYFIDSEVFLYSYTLSNSIESVDKYGCYLFSSNKTYEFEDKIGLLDLPKGYTSSGDYISSFSSDAYKEVQEDSTLKTEDVHLNAFEGHFLVFWSIKN